MMVTKSRLQKIGRLFMFAKSIECSCDKASHGGLI